MFFITQENEFALNEQIQVLYFYASWMPFHKKFMVMISKMEEKYNKINFIAIDTDYFKSLCRRFNIESIPTLIFLSKGEEIKRINGLILTSALKSALADICK